MRLKNIIFIIGFIVLTGVSSFAFITIYNIHLIKKITYTIEKHNDTMQHTVNLISLSYEYLQNPYDRISYQLEDTLKLLKSNKEVSKYIEMKIKLLDHSLKKFKLLSQEQKSDLNTIAIQRLLGKVQLYSNQIMQEIFQDVDKLNSDIKKSNQLTENLSWLISILTIILIVLIFFLFLFGRIIRPLERIINGIKKIKNDIGYQIPIHKNDFIDFKELISAINKTSEDLGKSQKELILNQKSLQENEERFRELFENSEVSIWNEDFTEVVKSLEELRKTGVRDLRKHLTQNIKLAKEIAQKIKVVDVNNATLRLFNANSKDQFFASIGKTFGDDAILVFIDELNAIWENKESFSKEALFKTLDGRTINGIVTFKIPKDIENFKNLSVSIVNVTDLKEIHQALEENQKIYKDFFEHTKSANIIYETKDNGETFIIKDLNHVVEDFENIKKSKVIGKKIEEVFEGIEEFGLLNIIKDVYKSGKSQKMPITLYKDKKRTAWRENYIFKLLNGDIVASYEDRTKEKILGQEIKDQAEIMIAQSRHAAMGEMISMIAHQWRQPLSVISMDANNMLLDIALENFSTTEAEKYANSITEQTQHLSKTIDDFRNFFKPDKVISEVNIRETVDSTLTIVKDSLKNNNIELTSSFETDKDVKAYPRELMQVFINIINNSKDALKLHKREDALINIRVYEDEKYINTEICDNGGGIDADILSKVFEPYFSTKDEKSGTGLGLYMSKMIIEEHLNGSIEAYNSDDGACFRVRLLKERSGKR